MHCCGSGFAPRLLFMRDPVEVQPFAGHGHSLTDRKQKIWVGHLMFLKAFAGKSLVSLLLTLQQVKASHMTNSEVKGTNKHNPFTGRGSKELGTMIPPAMVSLVENTSYVRISDLTQCLTQSRCSGHLH